MKNLKNSTLDTDLWNSLTPEGTSYFSLDVRATVNQLKSKLGDPLFEDNDGSDKTNMEWNCLTKEGIPFTIYDYKLYQPIRNFDAYIDWHIGARNQKEAKIAKEALIHFLSYGKDEHPGA